MGQTVTDDMSDVMVDQIVDDAAAVALGAYEMGLAQDAKLMGHGGLLDPGQGLQISRGCWTAAMQGQQDQEANRVGDG